MRTSWICTIVAISLFSAFAQSFQVTPNYYSVRLSIKPGLTSFSASSYIVVEINDVNKTGEETITLDAEDFQVLSLKIWDQRLKPVYPAVTWSNSTTYSIKLPVTKNTTYLKIYMSYEGKIYPPGEKGLFLSTDRKMVATNLYPDGARRVFPCIQDPQYKTPFYLAVDSVPNQWNYIINNFPPNTGDQQTPDLPTFGMGLIAGIGLKVKPLWYDSSIAYNGPKSSVVADALSHPYFQKLASNMERGMISVVVVPGLSTLSTAAYGLVFISDEVFANPGLEASASEKHGQLMATLNALGKHFLSISVTPKSWAEHWISTSLSLYLQYTVAQQILNTSSLVTAEVIRPALSNGGHKIVDTTITQDMVDTPAIYPSVYKGASLLFMLDNVLNTNIPDIITDFILKMSGKSVTSSDFLQFLKSDTYPNGIESHVYNWIYSSDFPCISVQNADDDLILGEMDCWDKSHPPIWDIPVTWAVVRSYKLIGYIWITAKSPGILDKNIAGKNGLFSFNPTGKGLYRTIYDKNYFEWLMLEDLNDEDKAAKLDDAFKSAWSLNPSENITPFFNALKSLSSKDGYATWKVTLDAFTTLSRTFFNSDLNIPLKDKLGEFISGGYTDVASWVWSKDYYKSLVDRMRASLLVTTACWMDVSTCRMDALNAALSGATNPDVWSEVMCAVILRSPDHSSWDQLLSKYQADGSQYRKAAIFNALACIDPQNSTKIDRYLNTILLDFNFTKDTPMAFEAVYNRPELALKAVTFLANNAAMIKNRVGVDMMKQLIIGIGGKLSAQDQIQQLSNIRTIFTGEDELVQAANTAMNVANDVLQIQMIQGPEVRKWLGLPDPVPTISPTTTQMTLLENPTEMSLKNKNGTASLSQSSLLVTGSAVLLLHYLH